MFQKTSRKSLRKHLNKEFNNNFFNKLGELTSEEIKDYMKTFKLRVEGVDLVEGDLIPTKKLKEEFQKHSTYAGATSGEYCVLVDKTSDDEIEMSYYAREFMGRIQKLRKEAGLKLDADIEIFYSLETEFLEKAIHHHIEEIRKMVMKPLISGKLKPAAYPEIASADFKLGKDKGKIWICTPSISFHKEKVAAKYSDEAFVQEIERFFESLGAEFLKSTAEANEGIIRTKLDGSDIELVLGEDFFLDGFKSNNLA